MKRFFMYALAPLIIFSYQQEIRAQDLVKLADISEPFSGSYYFKLGDPLLFGLTGNPGQRVPKPLISKDPSGRFVIDMVGTYCWYGDVGQDLFHDCTGIINEFGAYSFTFQDTKSLPLASDGVTELKFDLAVSTSAGTTNISAAMDVTLDLTNATEAPLCTISNGNVISISGNQVKLKFDINFGPNYQTALIKCNSPIRTLATKPYTSPGLNYSMILTKGLEISTKKRNYAIRKTAQILNVTQINPDAFDMIPSVLACKKGRSSTMSQAQILLQCVDLNTGNPVSGCKVQSILELGANDGFHPPNNHSSPRPLGTLSVSSEMTDIPEAGLPLTYSSPEVSGEIQLIFKAVAPDNANMEVGSTKIMIKNSVSFVELDVVGLDFVNLNSHPEGNFGTLEMSQELNKLVKHYRDLAVSGGVPENEIVPLRSEGASMPLGGLFDIKRDWKPSHCGHRDGETIDISLSTFNNSSYGDILKESLKRAIRKTSLDYPYKAESPTVPKTDHWHIQLK